MDRYAVIGHPVAHSLSPRIHTMFAEQTGQALIYEKLLAPEDGFAAVAEAFFAAGGQGLNVTVPFKGIAARWVDRCEPAAQEAGAVNTIARESGSFVGYNTDGVGLVRDLRDNHDCALAGRTVLVLGAGGAVRGVVRPLLALRPAALTLANRTVARAQALMDTVNMVDTGIAVRCCSLKAVAGPYDVVLNGTSAGLTGAGALVAESAVHGAFCYDLLYSAQAGRPTPFCEWAAGAGAAQVSDGLGMLVEQAAEAFRVWHGIRPQTAPVLAALRQT